MRGRVLFVGLALAMVGALGACGVPPSTGAGGPATVVHDYPVDAVVGFEVACRHQGGSLASCVCLIHGMENRYTYARFQALVAADNPNAPEYVTVARECVGK